MAENEKTEDSPTCPKKKMKSFVDHYKVVSKFGAGTFGTLYLGVGKNGRELALKVEARHHNYLRGEANVYRALAGLEGIAEYKWFGKTTIYGQRLRTLGLELLGPNLEDLLQLCGKKFSLKTVLLLTDQLITRLESVHERSYVHRDLKGENMAMGLGSNCSTVYLIDFGIAKQYLSADGEYMEWKDGRPLCGTARYVSLNVHRGFTPDRRDDMVALGYVLIYFLRGNLPWQNIGMVDGKVESYKQIMEMKMNTSLSELCAGFPEEFRKYFLHCQNLIFGEKPGYDFLRGMFRALATRLNYSYDGVYDWNEWEWAQRA